MYTLKIQPREKNLPIIPVATLLAKPPEYNAPPAILDACPNLSHLEKASVFVTVKLSAITMPQIHVSRYSLSSLLFETYQQELTK